MIRSCFAHRPRSCWLLPLWAFAFRPRGRDQIDASAAVYNSSGTVYGTTISLKQNGFIGTFLSKDAPGIVTIAVSASGLPRSNTVDPAMSIVIDDTQRRWTVGPTTSNFALSAYLPAGTHFLRVQFDNALAAPGAELSINNISVQGAFISNSTDPNVINSNALLAADTYIQNFRRGTAVLNLSGIAPAGTPVQIQLVRHAFRFGCEVPGFDAAGVEQYLAPYPAPGSTAAIYQQHFLSLFNGLTPGNIGKWQYDEPTRGDVTMQGVDDVLSFASTNHLKVRMHNLIWGSQQPTWVQELASEAQTPAVSGVSNPTADLMSAIQYRIGYYVQQRANQYDELDVYNEPAHTGAWQTGDVQPEEGYLNIAYWNIFGPSGIASIYSQVAQAAQQAGNPQLKLFTIEYNVLDYSATPPNPSNPSSEPYGTNDPYANWYRQLDESILASGGALSGVGVEYYSLEAIGTGDNSSHNPGRIEGVFNNLAVLGLPIELTEFGIQAPSSGGQNQQVDAQILEETMRLVFGNPAATGFTMFGFWAGDVWSQAPNAVLYDANWNLTQAGQPYLNLMNQWNTQVSTTVGKGGLVTFTGFYGDYTLTVGDKTYTFTFQKGNPSPTLTPQ